MATAVSRIYGPDDLAPIEELARRAALAVDNARLYAAEQAARRAAEQATERTAGLQAVTAALTAAPRPNEAADVVIRHSRAAMYENPDYLLQAIRAGAAGYLLKNATTREVVTAVRQVLHGEFPLRPGVAAHLLQRLTRERERQAPLSEGQLTWRGQAVLRLVARGQTNRAIARTLHVSVGTVKLLVSQIIAKLGVSDHIQAAVRAVELRLVTPPPV